MQNAPGLSLEAARDILEAPDGRTWGISERGGVIRDTPCLVIEKDKDDAVTVNLEGGENPKDTLAAFLRANQGKSAKLVWYPIKYNRWRASQSSKEYARRLEAEQFLEAHPELESSQLRNPDLDVAETMRQGFIQQ